MKKLWMNAIKQYLDWKRCHKQWKLSTNFKIHISRCRQHSYIFSHHTIKPNKQTTNQSPHNEIKYHSTGSNPGKSHHNNNLILYIKSHIHTNTRHPSIFIYILLIPLSLRTFTSNQYHIDSRYVTVCMCVPNSVYANISEYSFEWSSTHTDSRIYIYIYIL